MQNLPPSDGDRQSELCRLAAEHGYRVVPIYTADCGLSAVEYVLIDLTTGGFGEPLPALEAPGGLNAIADQLAERINVERGSLDPTVRVDPFEGGLT
jgi:hypothetical protein